MAELPDAVRASLEAASFWMLATINDDGRPQVNPMWVDADGERVILVTVKGRHKERNLRRDPRVTIATTDRDNPYAYMEVRGTAVEFIEGDEAEAAIDMLAKKYLGEDTYPWRSPGEHHVKVLIEPTYVYHRP